MSVPTDPPTSQWHWGDLAILSVLAVGGIVLLLSYTSHSRENARRTETVNNLKDLALGLHSFHDSADCFPSESPTSREALACGGKPVPIFRSLIPYVAAPSPEINPNPVVREYLCLNRHPYAAALGPVADFGYQSSNTDIASILDAPTNLDCGQIACGSGISSTLLLSMVSEKPSDYALPSLPSLWTAPTHGTVGSGFTRDSNAGTTGVGLGSPYAATPGVYVDGHVCMIPHPSSDIYRQLWSVDNRTPFTAP